MSIENFLEFRDIQRARVVSGDRCLLTIAANVTKVYATQIYHFPEKSGDDFIFELRGVIDEWEFYSEEGCREFLVQFSNGPSYELAELFRTHPNIIVRQCYDFLIYSEQAIWGNERYPVTNKEDLLDLSRIRALRGLLDEVALNLKAGNLLEFGSTMFKVGHIVRGLATLTCAEVEIVQQGTKTVQSLKAARTTKATKVSSKGAQINAELRRRMREKPHMDKEPHMLEMSEERVNGKYKFAELRTIRKWCLDVPEDYGRSQD